MEYVCFQIITSEGITLEIPEVIHLDRSDWLYLWCPVGGSNGTRWLWRASWTQKVGRRVEASGIPNLARREESSFDLAVERLYFPGFTHV